MARLLYKQDSTAVHKRLTRRHIRLCGQVKDGDSYAQLIQSKLDKLIQAELVLLSAEDGYENTYDDLILKDSELDASVRTVYERTHQYDRENRTDLSALLFPDLTFSDIAHLPYSEEPKKVSSLIQKMGTLAPDHELRSLISPLQKKVDAVNLALDARKQAADVVRIAQVDVELAKSEVRAQYEANYLDARRSLGKRVAESLFPKVTTRDTKATKTNEADVNSGAEE
jgi:hypothetical protein